MALYHLTAQTGTRATGASALAKVQYIQREARYARVPDAVVYTTSQNLPTFAEVVERLRPIPSFEPSEN